MIKKYGKHILVSIILLGLIYSGYKACNIYDGYSELRGKYNALLVIAANRKVGSELIITDQSDYIQRLSLMVRGAFRVLDQKDRELKQLDQELSQVDEVYIELRTDKERIDNLLTQVSMWKEKFTIAEGIISTQKDVIFSLSEKYDAQVKITVGYKGMYEREHELHLICQQRLNLATRKLSGQKFISSVKTIIVLGLSGVMIAQVIK